MEEKRKIIKAVLYPALFVAALWLIRLVQAYGNVDLLALSIRPRTAGGLSGIIFSPLLHAGYDHLISNTMPLLVAGAGIFYFYREVSLRLIGMVWLFTGFWVWLSARPEPHIGASGLIYSFVCFLFFSGILRKDRNLLAISLLIVFLYGGMVWGILPVSQTISWESHLFGSAAGIIAAFYFRNEGPPKPAIAEDTEPTGPEYWMTEEQKKKFPPPPDEPLTSDSGIHYIYKEDNKGK